MGIYSTRVISREEAITRIDEVLRSLSNQELAGVLFQIFSEKTWNNFEVKDRLTEEDEEWNEGIHGGFDDE